ncbi:sensor histidine kinase [Synoicihabitans lomoniglobus]|uniref:HAMP domain-containing sensor histidine kinase n=1 Tax=Synoicihabitans lomoniglobus TaxID=2909285 RepID=A0AAE9ZV72_9BACT|nr:HAMP domain-containing histidine kinase [Opitutaceae bacterium LMO-M01]WED64707.1 HAMP domain-containing sensor histidine kinase [Opitutaceae bacterium LMO-M01]
MPAAALDSFRFQIVGPPATTAPVVAWLEQAGVSTDQRLVVETPAELPAPLPSDEHLATLATDPGDVTTLLEHHLLVGGWDLSTETPTAVHFHLSGSTPPPAAAEILRLAHLNRRHHGELRTISHRLTHDYMSPLGAVITTAATLRDPSITLEPEDRELVEAIATSGEELKQLLLRIRYVLQASLKPPAFTVVDMTDVFWQLRDLLQSRVIRAQAHVEWPDDGGHVRGVTAWILQMFEELLINAFRHNPPGVEISVEVEAHTDVIRFAIVDNGRGPATDAAALIVPFHRRTSSDHHGWGLTIVQRLAELQHGTLGSLPPTEGRHGFYLELPRAAPLTSA